MELELNGPPPVCTVPIEDTTAVVFIPAPERRKHLKLFEFQSWLTIQLSIPFQCLWPTSFSVEKLVRE